MGHENDIAVIGVRMASAEAQLSDHEERLRELKSMSDRFDGAWKVVVVAAGLSSALGSGVVAIVSWWLNQGG